MYILETLRRTKGSKNGIYEMYRHYEKLEKACSTEDNHIEKMRIIDLKTGEVKSEYKRL